MPSGAKSEPRQPDHGGRQHGRPEQPGEQPHDDDRRETADERQPHGIREPRPPVPPAHRHRLPRRWEPRTRPRPAPASGSRTAPARREAARPGGRSTEPDEHQQRQERPGHHSGRASRPGSHARRPGPELARQRSSPWRAHARRSEARPREMTSGDERSLVERRHDADDAQVQGHGAAEQADLQDAAPTPGCGRPRVLCRRVMPGSSRRARRGCPAAGRPARAPAW